MRWSFLFSSITTVKSNLARSWPALDDFAAGTNGWTGTETVTKCGSYTMLGGYNVLGANSYVEKTYDVSGTGKHARHVQSHGVRSYFPLSFPTTMASASNCSSSQLTAVCRYLAMYYSTVNLLYLTIFPYFSYVPGENENALVRFWFACMDLFVFVTLSHPHRRRFTSTTSWCGAAAPRGRTSPHWATSAAPQLSLIIKFS